MLTIEKLTADTLGIDITGRLTIDDIETAIAAIEEMRDSQQHLSLMIDLSGFAGMTPKALLTDVRYGLTHISDLKHYKRIAIIANHGWLASLAKIEAHLVPHIDMRVFNAENRQQARSFATGQLVDMTPQPPHIEFLPTDRPDMVALRINNHVTNDDVKAMMAILSGRLERFETLDMIVIINGRYSFDPRVLLSAEVWRTKATALKHVRRYAVVGAPKLITTIAEGVGTLVSMEIKAFDSDSEPQAWQWLNAAPRTDAA